MGEKGKTSENSCGPRHPEWERRKRQVYKAPRVGNKGGLSVNSCGRVGDKGEPSINSCGSRHPEWETNVGDKAQGTQSAR